MKRPIMRALLSLALVAVFALDTASAQNKFRSDRTVYLKARVGAGNYWGDRDSPMGGDAEAKWGLNAGAEVGYQFSNVVGVGVMFNFGQFAQLEENDPHGALVGGLAGASKSRTGVHLIVPLRVAAGSRISPYIYPGVGAHFGTVNDAIGSQTALGIVGGAGLDIAVSNTLGFFVEGRGEMTFDDEKLDGVGNGDKPDFIFAATVGLRLNFSKPWVAVVISSATGPAEAITGEDTTFDATINQDATQPVTATWDFGDGSTGSGLTATHQYDREGTYTVTFTAANKRSSDSRSFTVKAERPILAPSVVTVTSTPTNPDTQTPVTFNANIRGDQPMTYTWDFGDGGRGSGASPQHTYTSPGTYTVRLTASNEGGSDTRTVTVTVVPYEAEICKELTDLNPAFFDRNSSTLSAEARAALQDNLDILNECPNICVKIDGLAAPGERSAQDLSESRARAVEKFYTDNGIAVSRLVSEGKGRAPGVTRKEGLSQYRRADSIPGACGM